MNSKQKRILINSVWLVNLLAIVVAWFFAHRSGLNGNTPNMLIALGSLSGYVAGYLLLTQLILISGARWLESHWGLDNLSRNHASNGKTAFYFVLAHFTLIISGYILRRDGSIVSDFFNTYLDTIQSTSYFMLAGIAWTLLITVIATSIAMVRKRLPYELWHLIHFLAYLAVLLPLFHQVEAGRTTNSYPLFKAYWVGLYAFSFSTIIYFKWIRPLWLFMQHRFVVDEVVPETEDITSVYIKVKNIEDFKYRAGQFAFWLFLTPRMVIEKHPFTISSSPGDERLRISVKNSGTGSSKIQQINPGTKVFVDGPYGIFTDKVKTKKKRLFIAGGVGITPIASQLNYSSSADDTLIYAVRSVRDLALKKELSSTKANLVAVFSEQQHKGALFGKIDEKLLSENVKDIEQHDVWICGPPKMIEATETALIALGVPKNQIHTERFSL